MRLNNLRTWLMGTAAVLTFFVANETADAATTTTSTTASETTRTSSSSIAAKRVALRQTTSSVEESSANAQASSAAQSASGDVSMAKTTSSEPATSSASSTTAGHATSVADATKTVSADTTAKSQGTTATDQITSQSSSVRAKNEQAQTQNKQQMTRMYSGVITSQKGSPVAAVTVNKAAVLPAKMLLNLSRASLAKESTPVEGLNAADATVTDDQGVTYSATDELSLYANYNATYHWTIADGVKVAAGSTATVTLPDNVAFTTGTHIDLKKADGTVVGIVTAEAGSQTGTLTFNDYFANNDSQNRQGDLTFYVTGTSATVGHNTSSINKVGWGDSNSLDANGVPTKMIWQVVANINSAKWQQVKIVDQLGLYQTHEGTMTLETGYYTDGAFVKDVALGTYDFATQQFTYAEGVSDPQVTVKVEGQQMTITIDHLETAVNLFYEVGLTAGHTYANNASVTYTTPGTGSADPDPGDGSSTDEPKTEQSNTAMKFGGSGTASDEVKSYSLLVTKTDDAGQPVAGATYQLETGGGVILRTDLVTDESGQLRIGNLSAGSYVLVETKAPNGYQLDSTRHEFDVSSATTNIVTDSVVDHRISQTALTVNKVWAGVPTGVQTPSVEVTLQRNGQDYRTLQLTAANGYTGTFDQLDVTDVNGQPYTYTVVETALAGYTSSQTTSGQTVTITNTYQT
ncbi:SpaA isopeptide-forming pilin-related protein, partial [Levilactobacillus brevis]